MSSSQASFCYLAQIRPDPSRKPFVSSHLRSLGCNSFNNLFWRVPGHQLRAALSHSEMENIIVLKRSRNIVRHFIDEKKGIFELGSLMVVAFRLNMPPTKTRKVVQRALQRAPCFKLCSSVYAFPQLKILRTIGHNYGKDKITTPRGFVDVLNELGSRVIRLSRMTVLDHSMSMFLVQRMKAIRRAQCKKLVQACKNLSTLIRLQGEYFPTKTYRPRLSELKYRYRAIRTVLNFFRKEMNIDMRKELVKVSRAIGLCRKALREIEERKAVIPIKSPNY
nr:hypothetical protein [Candidatus Njordarchaeum guaymaensis]